MKKVKLLLGGIMVITGVLIITGIFDFRFQNKFSTSFRVMFGIVLMLMGVYRIVILINKKIFNLITNNKKRRFRSIAN